MEDNSFSRALFDAFGEMEQLKAQEKKIFVRKAQLKKTIDALYPLVFPESEAAINSLTLADAVRLVFNNCARPLSAVEVRSKLEDVGFDLGAYDNALASIHTAMNRMIESEELVRVSEEGKKKVFERGPSLKEVPDTNATPDEETLSAMLEGLRKSLEGTVLDPNASSPVIEGEKLEELNEKEGS